MTVYSCCMFLNENDLFEIRLNEQWDYVDKFIVIEAGETHTGLKKPLQFDHARFEKYASKIVYHTFASFDEEMPKYPGLIDNHARTAYGQTNSSPDFVRDHFQHNYMAKILFDIGAQDTDLVYISSLDEIVKQEAFEQCVPVFAEPGVCSNGLRPVFFFRMYLYAYKFNLMRHHWTEHIAGMLTEFSNFKRLLPATIRQAMMNTHEYIEDGGWHFTFLDKADGDMVLEKQKSWAHSKDEYPGMKRKFDHTTKEEAVERLFHDYKVELVEITEDSHPQYIVNNLDKLQNFIYKDELK